MIGLALLLALVLGLTGWLAIAKLGWWVAGALAYLYLLGLAAVASVGGINAALTWWTSRRP